MRLNLVTGPAVEPLSLPEAKAELKVEFADDDALITAKVREARSWAETYLRRALLTQTWDLTLDSFPDADVPILLPLGRTTKVHWVKYKDSDGVVQTLYGPTSTTPGTGFQEDLTDDYGGLLMPEFDDHWPPYRKDIKPITIRFDAGYGAASTTIPPAILTGVRARLCDIYEIRGAVDTPRRGQGWSDVAETLLHPFRIRMF